ncbi:5'-deoxyadenosine deaminase [Penicillium subrubescens]|uniref:5'-deoxyadenosine deaminase n=2 Tax=Penicillium subrubescens TaxID=1316194 RepID=A0A1Q5UP39_9EURO|nr:5'-deoxyadenosine deaminase [Penicillium subrubescens]
MNNFRKLAHEQPFGPNGRARLGFAIDTMFVQPKVLKDAFNEAREHGVHLITSHITRVSMMDNMPSAVAILNDNGLLGPDVLLSHGNNITREELQWIETAGVHLSSTPLSEVQMGHGYPICLEPDFLPLSSIGTDSNSICTSSIPAQASTALQTTRARQMAENMKNGTWDGTIGPKAEDAFNLGTILGARAISLGDEIGSLTVGKKADIVIFQGQTPTMTPASDVDPIAAIILHSSVRDVRTVIVDGVIRKENGYLCKIDIPADITENARNSSSGQKLFEWKDVAKLLRDSRLRLEAVKTTICDEDSARNGLIRSFLEAMMHANRTT